MYQSFPLVPTLEFFCRQEKKLREKGPKSHGLKTTDELSELLVSTTSENEEGH